ncbi:MAG: metal-dependent hydrolase [Methanosarcinales archaeon]|nr:metal-dependent hydrolase [Methanosarcinales archaeon]
MLIFGHLGVTLAIAFILKQKIPSIRGHLDYRIIALGALLPDLIDKLFGRLLFPVSIANGRIIGHTLMFVIILLIGGYILFKRYGDSRVVQVAGASFMHLVEDRMWNDPQIFFWPAMGWVFPRGNSYGNFIDYLMNTFSHGYIPELSFTLIFECIGFFVILSLLFRNK